MVAPTAPRATMTLADARLLWRAANLAERRHHDTCRLYRLGMGSSCRDCREYEHEQDAAADQVTRVRMGRATG